MMATLQACNDCKDSKTEMLYIFLEEKPAPECKILTRAKLIKLSMCNHIHSKQHSANSTNFKFSLVRILIRIKACSTKNDLYRLEWLQCYRSRQGLSMTKIATKHREFSPVSSVLNSDSQLSQVPSINFVIVLPSCQNCKRSQDSRVTQLGKSLVND